MRSRFTALCSWNYGILLIDTVEHLWFELRTRWKTFFHARSPSRTLHRRDLHQKLCRDSKSSRQQCVSISKRENKDAYVRVFSKYIETEFVRLAPKFTSMSPISSCEPLINLALYHESVISKEYPTMVMEILGSVKSFGLF